MSRELTPERQAAHIATIKTLIFDAAEHTKDDFKARMSGADAAVAVGAVMDNVATAADDIWPDSTLSLIGLVSVLGHRLMEAPGNKHLGTALNALSALLGADLITTPLKERLDKLQDFADAIAILDTGPDTDAMLCNVIERARDVSEQRPGGFTSPTPLNDVFRRGQEVPQRAALPPAPWPVGKDNAKREGWKAYFEGRSREKSPFPHARPDLLVGYREGWDAADLHDHAYLFAAEVPGHEAPEGGEA